MNIIKSILDAIFPPNFTCEICGIEIFDGGHFCKKCKRTFEFNNGDTCPVCGRKTKYSALCLECKACAPRYDKAISALVYGGGVQNLILKYKNGQPYLKDYFSELIYEKCWQLTDAHAVCFVPMTKSAERKRGFNQSYLLAKELAGKLNLPLLKNAVKKIRETSLQKTLTKSERALNLKTSFKANREEVAGKNIIVVDDVLTTGATADAICGELKKRGAAKIYFVTVASVEYNGEI